MPRAPVFLLTVAVVSLAAAQPTPAEPAERLTARTPDRMLSQALRRASSGGQGALAGLAVAWSLADDAPAGEARRGLQALGRGAGEVAEQARWLAALLDPDPAARPAGLVRNLAVLGPFRDQGGGLARREGPEAAGPGLGRSPGRLRLGRARGALAIGARRAVVTARGVPLDLMIHPRRESCSYLATRVRLPAARTVVLAVAVRRIGPAAPGTAWRPPAATRPTQSLVFDRIAARIEAGRGDHLLAVKVCSGAIDDRGRVRIRAQDAEGRPARSRRPATTCRWPAAGQIPRR